MEEPSSVTSRPACPAKHQSQAPWKTRHEENDFMKVPEEDWISPLKQGEGMKQSLQL